jgi:DNA-directed RNA polymerase subunit N (RpoN/RPB10)
LTCSIDNERELGIPGKVAKQQQQQQQQQQQRQQQREEEAAFEKLLQISNFCCRRLVFIYWIISFAKMHKVKLKDGPPWSLTLRRD